MHCSHQLNFNGFSSRRRVLKRKNGSKHILLLLRNDEYAFGFSNDYENNFDRKLEGNTIY